MKTLNTKLIVPFIITLLLTGCMPDSLTKFNKEEVKKAKPASTTTTTGDDTTPVVDNTGTVVSFTHPTTFYLGDSYGTKYSVKASTLTAMTPILNKVDGSLGGATASTFITGCSILTTGDAQTMALPAGVTLSQYCVLSGNPTVKKSITTAFCSDLTSPDQTTCEAQPYVWDSATSTCSNNDFQFNQSQAACEAGFHKWYAEGAAIPYKVELRYKNASGTIFKIYTTLELGTYDLISKVVYNQSDKLILKVTGSTSTLAAIVPQRTTTSTTGTYPSTAMISSANSIQGVANYVDTSQSLIGIKKLIKMTLNTASSFSAGGFLTTAGNIKVGKIFKKDSSNTNIIYVENISDGEIYFQVGDQLDNTATFASTKATITNIDETPLFDATTFPALDNDIQYFSSKFTLDGSPVNSYLINSATNIKPIKPLTAITINNGTVVTITPKLPVGLTLDPKTGIITGKVLKVVPVTSYTITATNPVGSVSTTFKLISSNAPADLALSTKQIITVSSTAFFLEGETLFQQTVPPLAAGLQGRILKILNGYQMAIDAPYGAFLQGASLDSGNAFFSEKAYIIPDLSCTNTAYATQSDCEINSYSWSTGPVFYNLGLKLDATTTYYSLGSCSDATYTTQATCEDTRVWDTTTGTCSDPAYTSQSTCELARTWGPTYVTNAAGAKGVVAGIFKGMSNDTLFVRHLTQNATSVATALVFNHGDVLNGSTRTIEEIDYNYVKLLLTSAASFSVGKDVTSDSAGVAQSGAYTYAKSGNTISVSDITRSPSATLFKTGDTIYANDFNTGASTTIANVSHDVLIVAEKGKKIEINTALSNTNSTFAITPALPTGITLNTRTGVISGTPTVITAKKDFILTATNFIGQAKYVFSMEVRDYLTLTESSGAPSFLMHKVGNTQVDRKCRINASDIINNVSGLDIRCNLEAEEEDLYTNGIKFKLEVGAGICQYLSYQPYYQWRYAPAQSANTSVAYPATTTVYTGCDATTNIPTADLCDGNYTTATPAGPNCDEGKLMYSVQARTGASGACVNSGAAVTQYVQCGGKKANCMAGPVKDLLTDAQLAAGSRGLIYQSPNGLSTTWPITSPRSLNLKSNLKLANFTAKNLCSQTNADVNTWAATAAAASNLTVPFGASQPFYTFSCLNAASQIKARIRVIVRDWDRNFKIDNGIDLVDPSSTTTGIATDADGAFMDNAGADSYGNDFNNYDDLDNTGANYTGGSCGVIGAGVEYPFAEDNL